MKTTKITIEGQPSTVDLVIAKIRDLWDVTYESKDKPLNNPHSDVRRWIRVRVPETEQASDIT